MFNRYITPAQYLALSSARRAEAVAILMKALEPVVPSGYVLSVDPQKMYGNALIALRPAVPVVNDRMICFIHSINYRHRVKEGQLEYLPTLEVLRAVGDIRGATLWYDDTSFGSGGRIVVENRGSLELAGMVRDVVAEACSSDPFVDLQWRKHPSDGVGRWDLILGDQCLQTVTKTGSRYSTEFGPCPKTLREAQTLAEAAARATIRTAHAERLAGLDDENEEESDEESVAFPCAA